MFKKIVFTFLVLLFSPIFAYGMDVTLEWDANSEDYVIGYSVYCRNSKTEEFRHLEDVIGRTNTTITFYDLADMNWCFVVTAFSIDKESDNSNEVCTDDLPTSHSGGGGGQGCFINTSRR